MKDEKITERSDQAVAQYKLKEYLEECIRELNEEYIQCLKASYPDGYVMSVQRHRNMFLCIKEICKARNKF